MLFCKFKDKEKEQSPSSNNNDILKESDNKEEFVPETGLAKSRMKQYLETASTNANGNNHNGENGEQELPGKGIAKSLLAKWKSMENVKDKEGSPEPNGPLRNTNTMGRQRAISKDRQTSPPSIGNESPNEEYLPQSGTAKTLLNKWQNIDSNTSSNNQRKGPRPITPPPADELSRNRVCLYTLNSF